MYYKQKMQTWVIIVIALLLVGGVWWWMDRQKKKPPPPPGPHPHPTPGARLSSAQLHQYAVAAMAGDASTCMSLLQSWGVPTGQFTTPAGFDYLGAWKAVSWLNTEQLSVLNGLRLTSNPNCRTRLLHWGVYHDFADCNAAYEYYSTQ